MLTRDKEHYFEMSRPDAERALHIYKAFARLTEEVVKFLAVARQYQNATRLEIPKIKHAPTSLTKSLEDYLRDQDFETNRRQYLASKDSKANGAAPISKPSTNPGSTSSKPPAQGMAFAPPSQLATAQPKGPPADLIDFFGSIEQNQQSMDYAPTSVYQQQPLYVPQFQQPQYTQPPAFAQQQPDFAARQAAFDGFEQQVLQQQPQFQPTSIVAQPTNPFGHYQQYQPQQQAPQPLKPQFTGAGFGGYGPQPEQNVSLNTAYAPQSSQSLAPQPTSNPFRTSMMPLSSQPYVGSPPQSQQVSSNVTGRNPFAKPPTGQDAQFADQETGYQQSFPLPQQQSMPAPLQPQATGTNPFARGIPPPPASTNPTSPTSPAVGAIVSQSTGSTNPFRQSAFVDQQTGRAWQHLPQGTMGGLESLETVAVFPRPGQTAVRSPWG